MRRMSGHLSRAISLTLVVLLSVLSASASAAAPSRGIEPSVEARAPSLWNQILSWLDFGVVILKGSPSTEGLDPGANSGPGGHDSDPPGEGDEEPGTGEEVSGPGIDPNGSS